VFTRCVDFRYRKKLNLSLPDPPIRPGNDPIANPSHLDFPSRFSERTHQRSAVATEILNPHLAAPDHDSPGRFRHDRQKLGT
jgi:hypothetical protein